MQQKITSVIGIAALLFAICLAGSLDYEDEVTEERRYCAMVHAGRWPDFRDTYAEKCNEQRP